MLSIFTFVFGFVFKARLPGAETSITYVIWLIAGYGPWVFIAEGLSLATNAFVKHATLIRNISFRRELLVFAEALSGIVPMLVAVMFLAVLLVIDGRHPNFSWLVIPPILIVQYILICGFGLILGSINVFARDVIFALPNILIDRWRQRRAQLPGQQRIAADAHNVDVCLIAAGFDQCDVTVVEIAPGRQKCELSASTAPV